MANINDSIYGNVSLADVFKEIHGNQKEKNKQIDNLIQQLSPLVKNINDAAVVVPLIKEYLDVGVKNQPADWILSPDELKQIQSDLKGITQINKDIEESLTKSIK